MNIAQKNSRCKAFLAVLLLNISLFSPAAPAADDDVSFDFSTAAATTPLIDTLVNQHGFVRGQVEAAIANFGYVPEVIKLIRPASPATAPRIRSWTVYRGRFIEPLRINAGVDFWHQHAELLSRAEKTYGVPAEIIVAIIGVETVYGRNTGNFRTVDALATLAYDYPQRAELFTNELISLFLLARKEQRPITEYYGSYAGAIGLPQFLPSSIMKYGVDFDGDGHIDLENNHADAIGSVANYLKTFGWQTSNIIALQVEAESNPTTQALVDTGIRPSLLPADLQHGNIRGAYENIAQAATLVDLVTPDNPTEYWLGYQNFYVITRYNRSSFYAMSVFQLAEVIHRARANANQ